MQQTEIGCKILFQVEDAYIGDKLEISGSAGLSLFSEKNHTPTIRTLHKAILVIL